MDDFLDVHKFNNQDILESTKAANNNWIINNSIFYLPFKTQMYMI